jgi:hypothetical protein
MSDTKNEVTTELKKELQSAIESDDDKQMRKIFCKILLNTIELDIKTTVTSNSPKSIHTTINLLAGDINTTMHSDFASDPQGVADFHKEQVNKAEQIIARNVNTLKDMIHMLMDMR